MEEISGGDGPAVNLSLVFSVHTQKQGFEVCRFGTVEADGVIGGMMTRI
jgi:hypothetical protein